MNPTRLLVLLCWAKRGPVWARFPAHIGGDRGWEAVRRKVDGEDLVGLGDLGDRQRRREEIDALFALFAEREARRPRREAWWPESVAPRGVLGPWSRAQTGRRIDEVLRGLIGETVRVRRYKERIDRYVAGARQLIVRRPRGEKPHAITTPSRAVLQKVWPWAQPVATPEWPPLTGPRAAYELCGQEVQP